MEIICYAHVKQIHKCLQATNKDQVAEETKEDHKSDQEDKEDQEDETEVGEIIIIIFPQNENTMTRPSMSLLQSLILPFRYNCNTSGGKHC